MWLLRCMRQQNVSLSPVPPRMLFYLWHLQLVQLRHSLFAFEWFLYVPISRQYEGACDPSGPVCSNLPCVARAIPLQVDLPIERLKTRPSSLYNPEHPPESLSQLVVSRYPDASNHYKLYVKLFRQIISLEHFMCLDWNLSVIVLGYSEYFSQSTHHLPSLVQSAFGHLAEYRSTEDVNWNFPFFF